MIQLGENKRFIHSNT